MLALLSKEQGMVLPLLLLAATPLRRIGERGPLMLLLLMILWTLAGYIIFRERILKFWWHRGFLDPVINPIVSSTDADRLLMPFALLGRYVALLIAPLKLCPDYGGRIIGADGVGAGMPNSTPGRPNEARGTAARFTLGPRCDRLGAERGACADGRPHGLHKLPAGERRKRKTIAPRVETARPDNR